MKKKLDRILSISVYIMIILFVLLCTFSIMLDNSNTKNVNNSNQRIYLQGTYSIDNGKEISFNDNLDIQTDKQCKVVVKANSLNKINKNNLIILNINNMEITIKINGKEVFEFANSTSMFKSSGRLWAAFTSPGISTNDEIEIEMKNYYNNNDTNCFNEFINNIQTGSCYAIYREMAKKNGIYILISLAIIFIGIIGMITTFCVKNIKNELNIKIRYYSLFAFCGGICILLDKNYEYMSIIIPHILFNNVLSAGIVMFFPMSVMGLFLAFLKNDNLKEILKRVFIGVAIVNIIFIIEQFIGYKDLSEHVLITVFVNNILCVVGGILLYKEIKVTKDREQIFLVISFIPYFIFDILDSLKLYFNILIKDSLISYGIMFVVFMQCIQLICYIKIAIESKKREKILEKQIFNMKIDVMLHEIQPHFLYNSLTSISRLCDKDPKQAKQAIVNFATYLRGNLNSIKQIKPILFKNELNHVKKYVELEKMRFGDELNIIYDIKTEDFYIPPLTVQPIVENAIKHGISMKENGGTVTIATRENTDNYEVTISDDGNGFNENEVKDDGRIHIGMENAKRRLKYQCGGTISIFSKKDEGTIVKIYIPKNK